MTSEKSTAKNELEQSERQRLRMQSGRPRQYAGRIQRQLAPREIRKHTASLAHDHGECRDVEDVDVGLDDEVDAAACEQMIVVEVAVAARAAAALDQARQRAPAGPAGQGLDVADRDRRGRTEL